MTNARDYDNFCVFLSSYRNTIFNQSTRVFSLGYFLNSDKTWVFDQSERAQGPIYVIMRCNMPEEVVPARQILVFVVSRMLYMSLW